MNILILSAGTRNKIVQYFKQAIGNDGLVVATDCSPIAPAIYEADKHYIVPRITEPGYIDIILDICRRENIAGVLSLIDPELSMLAENAEAFRNVGTTVIGSDLECCDRALDKWKMFCWLKEHDYLCARSYMDVETFYADRAKGFIDFPVFVKPVCGSASVAISKVYDSETLELLMARTENLMIQEYLDGQEIGADCYIDMVSGETVSIFTKKKLVMRAGETDKAVSFKDEKLFALLDSFISESGYRGQIDIDVFDVGGEYYISEVNPRFGGGYPHAHECGCDHMTLIKNNLSGQVNERQIGHYEDDVYMMKYVELAVRRIVQ